MACRCSACTPKDTRILRFLPPSRPPNFYGSLGQITVSIHFFTFSKLSMLHHKAFARIQYWQVECCIIYSSRSDIEYL